MKTAICGVFAQSIPNRFHVIRLHESHTACQRETNEQLLFAVRKSDAPESLLWRNVVPVGGYRFFLIESSRKTRSKDAAG